MLNPQFKPLFFVLPLLLMQGCAQTGGVSQADRNQFVTEFYALVRDVNQIKFKSYASEAATVGAIGGALENLHGDREDMIGGAIIGGIFGGLLTSIFEGSNKGYEYQLDAIDGDSVRVIVDKKPAEIGDCVRVRVSGSIKVTKQPYEQCMQDNPESSESW